MVRAAEGPFRGVQRIVAQELIQTAMQLVGTRFGYHIHLRGATAVFGREVVGLHLYFLNRLNGDGDVRAAELALCILDSIEPEHCECAAVAIYRKRRSAVALFS